MTGPIVALFAEDEPIIQIAIEEALEEGGYAVLLAGSGLDAEALLESRHGELRALVTDIRLGSGPDGWELAHRARALNGQIAVVYITGDSAADWSANGVRDSAIIQKPFAEEQLLTALSTLLKDAG